MGLNGIVIANKTLDLATVTDIDGTYGAIDYGLDVSINDKLVSVEIDVTYYPNKKHDTSLISLSAKLNFWVTQDEPGRAEAEEFLFSVKMQNSYIYFILYQQLTALRVKNLAVVPPSDEAVYDLISNQIPIAHLDFGPGGNYGFPF